MLDARRENVKVGLYRLTERGRALGQIAGELPSKACRTLVTS